MTLSSTPMPFYVIVAAAVLVFAASIITPAFATLDNLFVGVRAASLTGIGRRL